MTFDEIVAAVAGALNLTSSSALTRIGTWVNVGYKKMCSDFGIQTISTVEGIAVNTTIGTRRVVISAGTTIPSTGIERLLNVYDTSVTPNRPILEISRDEMRNRAVGSDPCSYYAVALMGSASVTIDLDCVPATVYPLTFDGLANQAVLVGSAVPAFTEDYHDILVFYGLWRESLKMQQWQAAMIYEEMYHGPRNADGLHLGGRLADYRYYLALSAHRKIYQGKTTEQGTVTSARI